MNIIRAITALIIVIYHSKFILWCGGQEFIKKIGFTHWYDYPLFALDMLSSNGEPIVVCFFILSGFVITHSYRKSSYSIFHFYLIRLTRIYIPFLSSILLAIGILFLVNYINPSIFKDNIREYNSRLVLAWNNLNFKNFCNTIIFIKEKEYMGLNFVYWSLLHEVLFYLIYPMYHLIKIKGRVILISILILLFLLSNNHIIYYQIYFLAGIFIYDYSIAYPLKAFIKSKYLAIFIIVTLYLLMTIAFIKNWKISADIISAVMSFFAFDFVLSHISKPNKIILKLAEFSYTLYLNHLPFLLLIYTIFTVIFEKLIFYERYFYYLGVIFAVLLCKNLFFIERFSLYLIKKIKHT